MKQLIIINIQIFLKHIALLLVLLPGPNLHGQGRKLVFSAHWMPQAQFAGFYVAKDQGYYTEAGLDVEIIHPPASIAATEFLKDGRADVISLFLTTAINNRQKGLDLVNIGQLSQHSAILFVALKKNAINELSVLNGRKIGIWSSGFDEVPKAMVSKNGLSVEWIPLLSTVNLLLAGGIDAMTVMYYNEYNQVYLTGVDLDEMNTFYMSDYGFDIPEDGLYVLRRTAAARKEDLGAFVAATLRGWRYASENKDYTLDLVIRLMRQGSIPANRSHQKWMLDKVLEMQDPKGKNIKPAELAREDFGQAIGIMKNHYKLAFDFTYDDFFRPVLPVKQ